MEKSSNFDETERQKNETDTKEFLCTQVRYDNRRVRDSHLSKRLCYECGRILLKGEQEYQDHILSHEAAYIAIQLYRIEEKHFTLNKGDPKLQKSKQK